MTQTRSITTPAAHGGTICGATSHSTSCTKPACPVNCVQTGWVDGSCSVTCGTGTMTQTRSITTPAAHGGTACGAASQSTSCTKPACPVNCKQTGWVDGPCSVTCGKGTMTQTRNITTPAAHG